MIRFALAFTVLAGAADAQSVKLQSNEIEILLSGNTAVGVLDGVPYRQFFGDDGVTMFAQDDTEVLRGEWRVDAELDEYQSIWPSDAAWAGWYVMEFSGDWYWVSKTTSPTPFEVLNGERLLIE